MKNLTITILIILCAGLLLGLIDCKISEPIKIAYEYDIYRTYADDELMSIDTIAIDTVTFCKK